ncbi:Uncharacterised protein [Bordetella pertussis]|nr:Uncharacterised protein [Bordetella pertussis]
MCSGLKSPVRPANVTIWLSVIVMRDETWRSPNCIRSNSTGIQDSTGTKTGKVSVSPTFSKATRIGMSTCSGRSLGQRVSIKGPSSSSTSTQV